MRFTSKMFKHHNYWKISKFEEKVHKYFKFYFKFKAYNNKIFKNNNKI